MKIYVLSRAAAEAGNGLREPHVVISITTPRQERAKPATNEYTQGVLALQFHDLDRDPGPSWNREYFGEPVLFSEEQARTVLKFVEAREPLLHAVVVHCEAGISRSAGVGAALALIKNGDDSDFWRSGGFYNGARYDPNRHVYRILLEAAGKHVGPA